MVTVNIIYRTEKQNAQTECPIYLRITKDRKSKYIALGIRVKPEHWDDAKKQVKKSHPTSQQINAFITSKINEAQGVALELQLKDKYIVPQNVKEQVMGKPAVSFIKYFEKHIKELEHSGQMGSWDKAQSVFGKIKKYMEGKDLLFDEITVSWLKNYEMYMRHTLGNKTNTIHSNLKVIRKLINLAINEDLFQYERNPFHKYKLKWENVKKEFLSEDELREFELLELIPGSRKDHHRNMYVFAAYVGGLRISDILQLRWNNFDGEKIIIETQKTKSTISIKLPSKALEILEQYHNDASKPVDFIFPILKNYIDYTNKRVLFRAISSATAYTNTDLKDIKELLGWTKHIHFHTSRHTWATRALKKGMRIEYVSKLMGHASIKVTQGYAKIVNEELDQAMTVFG
ncbi:site-specific integrase [soil metagenome]